MTDLETYRVKAAEWCETMVPAFGKAARKGLGVDDDLALGRRYQKAKFDAGYAGINWPTDLVPALFRTLGRHRPCGSAHPRRNRWKRLEDQRAKGLDELGAI